jgi:hypothetical protein
VSENLSAKVSVYTTNPTGFSVQTIPRFFNPIRPRLGVYVITVDGASKRLQGNFGGFLRKSHRPVLGMSAYAFGRFVSSGLPCLKGMAFRSVVFGRDGRHADDTGLPANTRAHQQGFAIFLKFHDLGEVGAQGLPRQAACSVKISSRSSDLRASSPNRARAVCCRSSSA